MTEFKEITMTREEWNKIKDSIHKQEDEYEKLDREFQDALEVLIEDNFESDKEIDIALSNIAATAQKLLYYRVNTVYKDPYHNTFIKIVD